MPVIQEKWNVLYSTYFCIIGLYTPFYNQALVFYGMVVVNICCHIPKTELFVYLEFLAEI